VANLALKLDRLERLAEELLSRNQGPVYLKDGAELPEGVEEARVVWVKRVLLDPPDHPDEQLPEILESSPAIEKAESPSFQRKLAEPELGIC
jgi:hypothetical protein